MLTVKEILKNKIALDIECIDRVYLNGYVKHLQLPGGLITFIREQMGAHCPDCGTFSMRENGRYTLTLVDLPCSGRIVSLLSTVRRYFCDNRECPRVTFVEQLPEIAKRYARKTQRLTEKQRKVAYETGGEMGKRILAIINMPTSGDQILRLICHADEGEFPTPSVLGVDD